MSNSALNWAKRIPKERFEGGEKRFQPGVLKSILKEIADFEQGTGEAYCYVDTLVEFTNFDRKTVIAYTAELVRLGLLRDTGKRAGKTRQTPVYQLLGFVPDFVATRAALAKSPAEGTLSENLHSPNAGSAQPAENAEDFDDEAAAVAASGERVPPKGPLPQSTVPPTGPLATGERVPPADGKGPAEALKGSRRRDPNCLNDINPPDAHAPARRSARTRDPEPEPERVRPTAEQILATWRGDLGPILAGEIVLQLWNRRIAVDRNFPSWPAELRDPFLVALQGVADDAANLEISRGACSPEMRLQARTAAKNAATAVVDRYAQHHQVAA